MILRCLFINTNYLFKIYAFPGFKTMVCYIDRVYIKPNLYFITTDNKVKNIDFA